jgi:hypothetical protein
MHLDAKHCLHDGLPGSASRLRRVEAVFRRQPKPRGIYDRSETDAVWALLRKAIAKFDQALQNTQLQTYITSISQHDDREDAHGRLSMWRAFGNATARVAIVIKLDLGFGKNLSLGAELSPVAYFTDQELAHELNTVIANIQDNQEFLRSIDRSWLLATVHTMLASAIVCLKHEGSASSLWLPDDRAERRRGADPPEDHGR